MEIRSTFTTITICAVCLAVASCQTSDTSGPSTAVVPVDATTQDGSAEPAIAAINPNCKTELAAGPPPKPSKGADFGESAAKNTAKGVGRGLIQTIGGHFGGQIGAAAAGGAAAATVRNEEDIKGTWNITDGSPTCLCKIAVDGLFTMQGKGNDTGTIKVNECTDPEIAKMANWALGYSFTGYNAKFELKSKDKQTVLATLNRDGIHYFSGTLSNGTPITMWRDGQNYNQMKFGQSQGQPAQ